LLVRTFMERGSVSPLSIFPLRFLVFVVFFIYSNHSKKNC
jgi:hypothetical protein